MKKIKKLAVYAFIFMFITPALAIPKLPTIPNISGSVKTTVASQAAKKAGAEAVKKLNIDWSKFKY